jgi:hypothetical protein
MNKRERLLPVRPPSVEKTSRLGSRGPVASGVKCGPHGGKNSETKSWTVSWLSLKTKVEPGQCGSRVMSDSPENHWVTRLSPKTEAEDSTRRCGHPCRVQPPMSGGLTAWASLTTQGGRSDCLGRCRREASKRRTHVGIARLASRLSKVAIAGHSSDVENLKTSKFAFEGHVSLVI